MEEENKRQERKGMGIRLQSEGDYRVREITE